MYAVKEILMEKVVLEDFNDNKRMIEICGNICDLGIYELVKKAYKNGFIYPHIEEISKAKNIKSAELLYEKYIIENLFNYETIEQSCSDLNIKRQIYKLKKSELNLNIAKVIATAKDQFEAYNIRIAYTKEYKEIPDEFYNGIGLPIPSEGIWYVTPEQHKRFVKMLRK